MKSPKAIWITGVGTGSPLGFDYSEVASNLLAGKSGISRIDQFDTSKHVCKIAASLANIPVPPGWDAKDFTSCNPWEQLLLWSAIQAIQDAGLWEQRDRIRLGMVLGIGAEAQLRWESDFHQGGNLIHEPEGEPSLLDEGLRERLGISGPVATVAAACASGNIALAQGRRWVERGWVDVCLAGACDRSITPMGLGAFGNLGALSKRNDEPAAASRPFDKDRDGFIMGEGCALFILENAEKARSRGARCYGEVAGFGASSDAFHLVIPSSDPEPSAKAMHAALADAGISPDEIDYINAHATSTPVGDRFEARVLQNVLGDKVRKVPVSATKSMTGHMLSAAAAIEALACLVALQNQAIPPTINLENPDPECDLCHVAGSTQEHKVRVAVSNSFGFGGSNTCIVLRRSA